MSEKIKVNEKEVTREEFEKLNKKAEKSSDVKMVKVNENTYKMKIEG